MALRPAALFLVFAAIIAVVNAQPCIECNKCGGNNFCLSNCKRECPKPQVTINVEVCKNYGNQAGVKAMAEACRLALQYCGVRPQARSSRPPSPPKGNMVTLAQCGNAAFGVCQARSSDVSKMPCAKEFNNGGAFCDRATFQEFYKGLANERCNQESAIFDRPQGK